VEEEEEERHHEEVEDAVEDHFGVGGDNVATLGETPADGVQEGDEREVSTMASVDGSHVITKTTSGQASVAEEDDPDINEGGASEREVAPLVSGGGERADEAAYDGDDIEENGSEDVGPREAGREKDSEQDEGRGGDPADVAHVPNGTGHTDSGVVLVVVTEELSDDGGCAEVGGHGVVRDGHDGKDGDREPMEDTSPARAAEAPADHDKV